MKNRCYIFLVLTLSALSPQNINAQGLQKDTVRKVHRLVFSGGTQVGFWSVMGLKPAAISFNADFLNTRSGISVGLGWSHDHYKSGVFGNVRENIRIRMCDYFDSPGRGYYHYFGGAMGLSYWHADTETKQNYALFESVFPTLQLIYGFGIGLTDKLSWQNEIALGPPYALRTALALTIK